AETSGRTGAAVAVRSIRIKAVRVSSVVTRGGAGVIAAPGVAAQLFDSAGVVARTGNRGGEGSDGRIRAFAALRTRRGFGLRHSPLPHPHVIYFHRRGELRRIVGRAG